MTGRKVASAGNCRLASTGRMLLCLSILVLLPAVLAAPAALSAPGADSAVDRPRVFGGPRSIPPGAAATMARAKALMRQRRFEAAFVLLRPLVAQYPKDPGVRFLLGRAALEASQRTGKREDERNAWLDEAISAFRTMLIKRPELVRVRLELARAFFHRREDTLSRGHFERVLAGNPAPTVAANVHMFLRAIRARRRWKLYAGAALAPDTNIGRSSSERTLYLGGLPFRRGEETLPRSGVGLSAWAGGEYLHPVSPGLRLRTGASISRREYANTEFDRTFLSAHAGPRRLLDPDTEASLLASFRRLWRAGVPEFDEFGIRAETARRLSRRVTASVSASRHERKHRLTTWLDGPVTDASVRAGLVMTPTVRLDLAAGWARERPDSSAARRFRHERRWVRPGVSVDLTWGITIGGSFEQRWTDFDDGFGALTPSGSSREDRTRVVRASINKRDLTLFGFSPRFSLVREQRKSNMQGADYTRSGGELSIVRLF